MIKKPTTLLELCGNNRVAWPTLWRLDKDGESQNYFELPGTGPTGEEKQKPNKVMRRGLHCQIRHAVVLALHKSTFWLR